MSHERYCDLWQAIAREFGVENAASLQPGGRCRHTFPLPWKSNVAGNVFLYCAQHRTPVDGPPILIFQPDALAPGATHYVPAAVHYEWVLISGGGDSRGSLDAALHFDFGQLEYNLAVYKAIRFTNSTYIGGAGLRASKWTFLEGNEFYREGSVCYRYRLECDPVAVLDDPALIAVPAAEAMKSLILNTWPQVLRRWGRNAPAVFVCPAAWKLAEIAETLYHAWMAGGSKGPRPPHILICGGWAFSGDMEKHQRWVSLVEWAEERGLSHLIPRLAPNEIYTAPDLSGGIWWDDWFTTPPQTRPTDEAVAAALECLRANWEAIAGPSLAAYTWPLRFTGRKMRQLLLTADPEYGPPWGEWRSLPPDDRRLTFTAFRRAVNDAIAPLEVDHIDFRFPLQRG